MKLSVVKPFGSVMVEDRRAFEALLQPLRDAGGGHVVGVAVLAPSRVLFADGALRAAGEETEGGGGGEGDGPGGGEEARGELSSSATHRQSLLVLSRVFDALAASRGDDADRAEVDAATRLREEGVSLCGRHFALLSAETNVVRLRATKESGPAALLLCLLAPFGTVLCLTGPPSAPAQGNGALRVLSPRLEAVAGAWWK